MRDRVLPAKPGSPAFEAGRVRGRAAFAEGYTGLPTGDPRADATLRDMPETQASYRCGWCCGYCDAESEAAKAAKATKEAA